MICFDPDPKLRWLICPTHPDDEIAICCWIRRLTQQGNEVFICWTHTSDERTEEARNAARQLGVPQENLFFQPGRDGQVCDQFAELLPSFRSMMERVKPDRVACGAFEQGHLDHDATNWLVNQAYGRPVLEFPLYHTYLTKLQVLNRFADPSGEEILVLDRAEQRFKVDLAKQYPSQNIWSVLLAYECWQAIRLRAVELRKTERLRIQIHKDWKRPNLPYNLAAKVQASDAWKRWLEAIGAAP